jgi:hypothetical protein
MRNLLSFALCLPLAACVIGTNDTGSTADDDGTTQDPPPSDAITGLITKDATWTGRVQIASSNNATTRIEPGVTITVAPGAELIFIGSAGLEIQGTLKIAGTKAEKVQLHSSTGNGFAGLIVAGAPKAGTLDMTYAVMNGGPINTAAGSTSTITDSKMWGVPGGDLLIMNGGTLTMMYSQIGADVAVDGADRTHCNIHTGGNANTISITKSNINSVPYGMMLYGGQNAILTDNNWYDNTTEDVHTQAGVTGDLSRSWFDGLPPVAVSGATLTLGNLATTKLTDAGVR